MQTIKNNRPLTKDCGYIRSHHAPKGCCLPTVHVCAFMIAYPSVFVKGGRAAGREGAARPPADCMILRVLICVNTPKNAFFLI